MIDPEQPNLPAPAAPPERTHSLPIPDELWRRLGEESFTSATVSERSDIARHMPQLLAVASSMANPKERDPVAIDAFLAPLIALPSAPTAEASGEALMTGYRIGLSKVPNRLLKLAVARALQDSSRRWRPGPTELLAYVADEMTAIRRRLHRLEHMRLYPSREVPSDQPEQTEAERADIMAKLEALAGNIGDRLSADEKRRQSERPPSILAPREPDVPRVETLMSVHGISREEAAARVQEILSKRGVQ